MGVPRSSIPRPQRAQRGFALLITVTLLAFMVVLLLGLAVYTRVETGAAGNTQRQAQARENALFALNIALGQLQRHAGPDQRVTATAESVTNVNAHKLRYTGVWDSTTTDVEPLAWLVSGREAGTTEKLDEAIPQARRATLVGVRTDGSTAANNVVATLQDIRASGVPGVPATAGPAVIGRYAWWVGDQGVKAAVAVPDNTGAINYAPFDSAELRARIRQQIALGAGAADATSGAAVFEPRDSNNAALVANQKVTTHNQLAFLRTSGAAQLGLTRVQQNFHAWSPNNYAVLANTKAGGLRQDLSLAPDLLGNAFAAWVNHTSYMEDPTIGATTAPSIIPSYGSDSLRRRYRMVPHLFGANGSHQVGPVLSYFLLSFNVRTEDGSTATRPLEVRARWMLSLWNPYSSALVPEDLRVEVTGLPNSVRVVNDTPGREGPVTIFSLRTAFGSPLRINLPWISASPSSMSEDRNSWLPGRVYTWRSREDTSKPSVPPASGYESDFYSQTLSQAGAGVIRPLSGGATVDGNDQTHLEASGGSRLVVTLYAVRPDGDVRLGQFISPDFVDPFETSPQLMSQSGYQFSFVFRLAESIDTPAAPGTWLTATGRDIRRRTVPPEAFVVGENGNNPAHYVNYTRIRNPDRLLDRATDSLSYNEDVPVFELPRAPLLSLGALQHFRLIGQRPFMIGNSWGATFELNDLRTAELFDRFFFSGLVEGVVPATDAAGSLVLPNPLLKPLRQRDSSHVSIDDIRALAAPGGADFAQSSKFLLQSAAFNLNSVSTAAWAATLRGIRFPSASQSFNYLDASLDSGTAGDDAVATAPVSGEARFLRFSQSAQETFKAERGFADNDQSQPSAARTELFRQGMRTLSGQQLAGLAGKIVELVRIKHEGAGSSGGPYRSLEEFLSPSPLFAGLDAAGNPLAPRSLLEAAIEDSGINTDITEFSSQWLTQADIMTALAPVLFPRSDTFVIRTYGEAVNPAANATEGRAWCEAIVQRVPQYFDPAQPEETAPADLNELNARHGRRFKVVYFRWLTRSDI